MKAGLSLSYSRKGLSILGVLCIIAMISISLTQPVSETQAAFNLQTTPTPTATPQPDANFEDVTESAGVSFSGPQFGVSWGDYNNDGWIDIFVNNHGELPNLYKNNTDGTFTDVYTASKIFIIKDNDPSIKDPHGSSWGDYDNDGDLDFYITTGQQHLSPFYVNQGGTFTEKSLEAGVDDLGGRGRSANWIDYDNDGDLDLFKGNEIKAKGPDKLYRNNNDGLTFEDVSDALGISDSLGTWGNVWGDYDLDNDMDVVLTGGSDSRLYRNNSEGDGTFTNVITQTGIHYNEGRAWGADFGDYDNDGDLDLYIARGNYTFFDNINVSDSAMTYTLQTQGDEEGFDFESSSTQLVFDLLIENGTNFSLSNIYIGSTKENPPRMPFSTTDITKPAGQPAYDPNSDSGIFIWQDGDGTWHVRMIDTDDTQGRITTAGSFSSIVPVELDPRTEYNATPKHNRLYKNLGDGTFEEVGNSAGVDTNRDSKTGTWFDYNNDGWLDLYVVNSGNVLDGNHANNLYRNNGDGTFTDVAQEAGVQALTSGLGDCTAWADYDNNGFLDLFVVNDGRGGYLSGPHKLYRNQGNSNHWLTIKLVGIESNRQGIGAIIKVTTAGGLTQTRQVNNGSHFICQNSSLAHFGLGTADIVDTITVTWPSGQEQVLNYRLADQILTITEGESDPSPTVTSTIPTDGARAIPLDTDIVVDFSTIMDTTKLNVSITPTIVLSPTWSNNNTRLTLTSEQLFSDNTMYTISVTGQDVAGNTLTTGTSPNPWSFTTTTISTAFPAHVPTYYLSSFAKDLQLY